MKKTLSLLFLGAMVFVVATYCSAATPQFGMIRIGTASMTGNSFVQGSAIAQMITEQVDGMRVTSQATGGSADNCFLLQDGEIEIGFVMASTAKEASTGTGAFEGNQIDTLRGVGVAVLNQFHIIVNNRANITHPSDLRGRRIGVATMGGGQEFNAVILLNEFGIGGDEFTRIFSTMGEALDMVRTGQVDAVIYATLMGNANVFDILSSGTCTLLSLSQEDVDRIVANRSEFGPAIIPAGTYPDVPYDITTISSSMLLLTRECADEEAIYAFTRALFENNDELIEQVASLATMRPENATVGMSVPFHPGAERFLREIGALP